MRREADFSTALVARDASGSGRNGDSLGFGVDNSKGNGLMGDDLHPTHRRVRDGWGTRQSIRGIRGFAGYELPLLIVVDIAISAIAWKIILMRNGGSDPNTGGNNETS